MNEEKDDRNVDEHARARTPPPPEGRGSSLLRGCGIALGIAFLVFMFVVGACFMAF